MRAYKTVDDVGATLLCKQSDAHLLGFAGTGDVAVNVNLKGAGMGRTDDVAQLLETRLHSIRSVKW